MYGKHNVSGENLMYCLSYRSEARYADTATFEGHGLPLEGGRAGFTVCVPVYMMAVQIWAEKISYSLLPKKKNFPPLSKL